MPALRVQMPKVGNSKIFEINFENALHRLIEYREYSSHDIFQDLLSLSTFDEPSISCWILLKMIQTSLEKNDKLWNKGKRTGGRARDCAGVGGRSGKAGAPGDHFGETKETSRRTQNGFSREYAATYGVGKTVQPSVPKEYKWRSKLLDINISSIYL